MAKETPADAAALEPVAPAPSPAGGDTVTFLVSQSDGMIGIFDGGERVFYKVQDGEIVVPAQHVAAAQSIPGAVVKPESPAKDK